MQATNGKNISLMDASLPNVDSLSISSRMKEKRSSLNHRRGTSSSLKQAISPPAKPEKHMCTSKKSPTLSEARSSMIDPEDLDDLDRMLCHEEFTSLVTLVETVKKVQKLQEESPSAKEYYLRNQPLYAKSSLTPMEVLDAVRQMQERLSISDVVIQRGNFPLTDAMMDDNFTILQQELEFCETCLTEATNDSRSIDESVSSETSDERKVYSNWRSDILLNWVVENHKHPFMNTEEAAEIAARTGLSLDQVSQWLKTIHRRKQVNVGQRKGISHNHFLDYLFLADAREKYSQTSSESSLGRILLLKEEDTTDSEDGAEKQSTESTEHLVSSDTLFAPSGFIPFTSTLYARTRSDTFDHPCKTKNQNTTPPKTRTRGKKRSAATMEQLYAITEEEPDPQVSDTLQAVTMTVAASCEDPLETQANLEPIVIDSLMDDYILSVFAASWTGSSDRTDPMEDGDTVFTPEAVVSKSPHRLLSRSMPKMKQNTSDVMDWKELDLSPFPLVAVERETLDEDVVYKALYD